MKKLITLAALFALTSGSLFAQEVGAPPSSCGKEGARCHYVVSNCPEQESIYGQAMDDKYQEQCSRTRVAGICCNGGCVNSKYFASCSDYRKQLLNKEALEEGLTTRISYASSHG